MLNVNDVFAQGPEAVIAFCAAQELQPSIDELSMKQLADICWTQANALDAQQELARKWAIAALRGFEWLSNHASMLLAESAAENCQLLSPWANQDLPESVH